jgi:hypothetical protein
MNSNSEAKFVLIGIILGFTAGVICGTLSAVITIILK